jgi:hypothetical protein
MLERRWNEALQGHRLEGEIAELEAKKPAPLGEKEGLHLMQFGADLELAWSHPAATAATRKRILRTASHEIVVHVSKAASSRWSCIGRRRPHRAEAEDELGRQAFMAPARSTITYPAAGRPLAVTTSTSQPITRGFQIPIAPACDTAIRLPARGFLP